MSNPTPKKGDTIITKSGKKAMYLNQEETISGVKWWLQYESGRKMAVLAINCTAVFIEADAEEVPELPEAEGQKIDQVIDILIGSNDVPEPEIDFHNAPTPGDKIAELYGRKAVDQYIEWVEFFEGKRAEQPEPVQVPGQSDAVCSDIEIGAKIVARRSVDGYTPIQACDHMTDLGHIQTFGKHDVIQVLCPICKRTLNIMMYPDLLDFVTDQVTDFPNFQEMLRYEYNPVIAMESDMHQIMADAYDLSHPGKIICRLRKEVPDEAPPLVKNIATGESGLVVGRSSGSVRVL